jgi:hypothetical protein
MFAITEMKICSYYYDDRMIGVLAPLLMGIHNSLQHDKSAMVYTDAKLVIGSSHVSRTARIFPGNSAASTLQAFIVFTCQNQFPLRIAYRWSARRERAKIK